MRELVIRFMRNPAKDIIDDVKRVFFMGRSSSRLCCRDPKQSVIGIQNMTEKPNAFALIGLSGYVAPRHLRAIKENNGRLVAAIDPADSVGIVDSHFPEARFFTEFERFDRFVDLRRRRGEAIDYVSICSPNYLHDAHVRFALRSHADAICEKPWCSIPGISMV